jgi:Putative Actinobacterial Holin-X, holin superfamily III
MAHDHLNNSILARSLSDVIGDLSDLLQKEMRLARAEISAKLSSKLQASVWVAAAGLLWLLAALLVVQGLVFGIASFGFALHWSCLIVAVLLGACGAMAYFIGRAKVQEELMPERTIHQIRQDISTAKEQLS